jgi:glucose/arabinose dehydrogenase
MSNCAKRPRLASGPVVSRHATLAAVLLAALASAPAAAGAVRVHNVATFDEPVYVAAPRGDKRLFVVERSGVIKIVRRGRKLARPFLDIRNEVLIESPDETMDQRGLLSIAFAPDYRKSGLLFLAYTGRDDTLHVDEVRRSHADPGRADRATLRPVLNAGHAGRYHHGGQLQYGPDGRLYLSTGVGDTPDLAQDPNDLHGKILRIDPRLPGARPEIYASGLRNPWRFSFDRRTHAMAIGDVGDSTAEEVDYLPPGAPPGANFGYPAFEGNVQSAPAPPGYVAPVLQRLHSDGWCAIVGGYVVRDRSLRSLYGRYLYGDLCTGAAFSTKLPTDSSRRLPRIRYIDSFGEDGRGRGVAGGV